MSARRAADGGFARSAGGAAARGLLLVAIAVVLGIYLLNANDQPSPFTGVGAGDAKTTTTLGQTTTTVATAVRPPAQVKVIVANGSTVAGAAGTVSERLQTAGYNTLAPTNTRSPVTAAGIYFASGYQPEARALAKALGLGNAAVQPLPAPPLVDDPRGANVIVVLDANLASSSG